MQEAPFWDKLDAARSREAIRVFPDGLIILDSAGNPLFVNQEAAALTGLAEGQISVGPLLSKLLSCDVASCTEPVAKQLLLRDTLYSVFVSPVLENGRKQATAVFFRGGSPQQEAEAMKSDFISMASHELRNPLTSIKNVLAILRTLNQGEQAPQREKFIEIAARNTERIDALVNEYLDLARIEAGTMTFEAAEVDFADFAAGVVREFGERAQQKRISLQMHIAHDLPGVLADPRKLEQILFNLIGNALKFTPEGGTITMAAEATSVHDAGPGSAARPLVRVAVADTGCGIPEEKRALVFEKFYRVKKTVEQGQEGAGLGLAIVKKLVALHGGEIHVESNMPVGSRFVFTLPVCAGERRDHAFRLLFDQVFLQARRNHAGLTLLVFLIDDIPAPGKSAGETLENVFAVVNETIHKSLFRQTDRITQRTKEGMFVVFCEAETEAARAIHQRIRDAIFLKLQSRFGALLRGLRIRSGCSTYPAEADTQRDLLQQALNRATEIVMDTKTIHQK